MERERERRGDGGREMAETPCGMALYIYKTLFHFIAPDDLAV